MTLRLGEAIVVPYGSFGIRADVLLRLEAGCIDDLERPGAPVAVLGRDGGSDMALRLSDPAHAFARPPATQDLAHADTQLAFLEQHLAALVGVFSRPGRMFIARYFAALRRHIRDNAERLKEKAAGLAGLVEPDHWCFGGLMPLPRAHLYAPEAASEGRLAPQDFVAVDFAFLTGAREIVAVEIDTGRSVIGARKRALERLQNRGVGHVKLSQAAIEGAPDAALLGLLGHRFVAAPIETDMPRSPFRGRGISDPVPAAEAGGEARVR